MSVLNEMMLLEGRLSGDCKQELWVSIRLRGDKKVGNRNKHAFNG